MILSRVVGWEGVKSVPCPRRARKASKVFNRAPLQRGSPTARSCASHRPSRRWQPWPAPRSGRLRVLAAVTALAAVVALPARRQGQRGLGLRVCKGECRQRGFTRRASASRTRTEPRAIAQIAQLRSERRLVRPVLGGRHVALIGAPTTRVRPALKTGAGPAVRRRRDSYPVSVARHRELRAGRGRGVGFAPLVQTCVSSSTAVGSPR